MEAELISIIVPIYNVEKYLKKCINSIISQTYKNIEIILVNDGSTDNSYIICKEFKNKDKRIVLINKENGGLSDARNKGVEIAKGRYISFVDSDDYIEKEFISKMIQAMEKNDVNIVQCGIKQVDNKCNILCKIGYESTNIYKGRELIRDIYLKHNIENVVVWNKLYKSELLKDKMFKVGKIHEDEFFTYKVLDSQKKIAVISECLYNYRKNDDSIMNKTFSQKHLDYLEALKERADFFEKKDIEIYVLTVQQYLMVSRLYYCQLNKYVANSTDIQKDIVKEHNNMYKKIKKNISKGEKIKNLLFISSPTIYSRIFNFIKQK